MQEIIGIVNDTLVFGMLALILYYFVVVPFDKWRKFRKFDEYKIERKGNK